MKVRGHSNSNIRLILRAIPGFVEGESRSIVAIVLDAFLASLTRTVSVLLCFEPVEKSHACFCVGFEFRALDLFRI